MLEPLFPIIYDCQFEDVEENAAAAITLEADKDK